MKANSNNPRPNQIAMVLGLAKFSLKATFKNRGSLVFSLVFPLLFVLVFGAIGGGGSPSKIGFSNAISASSPVAKAIEGLASSDHSPITLQKGDTRSLEALLAKTKLDAVIEPGLTPGSIKVTTTSANPIGQATATQIINSVVERMNYQAAAATAGPGFQAPFKVETSDVAGRAYRYIDFALPGQVGFSMLSLSTFGVAFSFLALRRTLVLKRMFATSVKPLTFVFAQGLSRSLQGIVQTAIIIGVGIAAFQFHLANGMVSFLEAIVITALGILCFLGFGILISNIAKDEQSAPIALNLFSLPQFLLSGVFFPIDSMPTWVQVIGNNLPLSYFNIALRKVTSDGANLYDVRWYLLGMGAWAAFAYILAARTFTND